MTEPVGTVPASLSFDRIADAYDRTRGGMGRGRRFAEELAPFFDPSRPLFEVGIGTGLIALGLRELGFGVAGVDLSEAMARTARARIGSSVALGDARRLPVRDHALPQAFSVWVLHVVGDPGGVLAEVARVLAPSGRYAVIPGFSAEPGDLIGKAILEMQLRADPHGHRRDDEEHLRGSRHGGGSPARPEPAARHARLRGVPSRRAPQDRGAVVFVAVGPERRWLRARRGAGRAGSALLAGSRATDPAPVEWPPAPVRTGALTPVRRLCLCSAP